MFATAMVNPEYESETIVRVYSPVWDRVEQRALDDQYRLSCWGGTNLMTGEPYIVFTPPDGRRYYSVKQENLYKTFLLAANINFLLTGEIDYRPEKVYDAYSVIYPDYGMERILPKFKTF